MKASLLLLPFILLLASCKKDPDTTPNSPSNGANSCRVTSYVVSSGPSSNTTTFIRYDSKGRITKWGDDSLVYNDVTNSMSFISNGGTNGWVGKLNSNNQFTWVGLNYDFGHQGRAISYSSDGKIVKVLDSTKYHKYDMFRDWYYWGYKTLNYNYDGNDIKNITVSVTDSFPKTIQIDDSTMITKNFYETRVFTVNYKYNSQTVYKINPLMNVMGWVYGSRSNAKIPSSFDIVGDGLPFDSYNLLFGTGEVQGVSDGLPNRIEGVGITYDKCN